MKDISGYVLAATVVAFVGLIILKPAAFTDTVNGFVALVRNSFRFASQ